jgi:multidrug efflux pump subunit AcrB
MIRSESTPAGARVSCFFDPVGSDDDLGLARAHLVREKLETVRQALPEDVAAPVIWHVGLTRTLWILAREDLRSKLLSIPGVAGVDVCGAVAPDERTVIRVDLARATAMGVELWDVQKQIERLKGIGALVSAPQQRLPARVFEVDKAAAVAANISPADVSRVVKLVTGPVQDRSYDLETEPSGNAALDAVRVHGVALSRLVRVTLGLEPASIVRINHRRAIELAWEVEDDGSVLGRVKGALEGFRDVQTTLEDLSW